MNLKSEMREHELPVRNRTRRRFSLLRNLFWYGQRDRVEVTSWKAYRRSQHKAE